MEPKPTYELVRCEITEAQQVILTQKTPPNVVKHRQGPNGKMLSYVEHSWVTEQLNLAFNWAWSWEIREWRLVSEDDPFEVFVLGCLTVHTPKGDLVKTQFGSADVKRRRKDGQPLSIGDDLKAASSDALKKCASLLGLALDVYSGNGPESEESKKRTRKTNSKKQPNSALINAVAVKTWLEARVEQIDTLNLTDDAYEKNSKALATTLREMNLDPKAVIVAAWGKGPYEYRQIVALQNLIARTHGQEEIQHLLKKENKNDLGKTTSV